MNRGYWFESTLFAINKGEDAETNPGCYGKSLADWLVLKLSELGYRTEVIPEDWGWCIMCQNDEYLLWVGCGSKYDEMIDDGEIPNASDVVWYAFPEVEVPLFMIKSTLRKWFGNLDVSIPLQKLNIELKELLDSEPEIRFVDEP